MAEGEEEAATRGLFGSGDGESAETRRLLGTVTLADYLNPAAAGGGIEGRAAEVNAALKLPVAGKGGGVALPWEILETRAFTDTAANDGPEMQRPILQRLFGPGVMDAMGLRLDSVPAGRAEWPLISGGVAPAQAKEGAAAAAAVAATFAFANLKPKRLTGVYEYTHEEAASVAAIEQALRRDLADAVKASMSHQIINGAAPTNTNPHHVQGFLATITAPGDAADTATYADYAGSHASGIDGIHAEMEAKVSSVVGVDVYQHAATVYQTGSGESGSEALRPPVPVLPGVFVHSGGHQCRPGQGQPVPSCRPERRGNAWRLGGGDVADSRNHPRPLHQGVTGSRSHVGCSVGCQGGVPVERVLPGRLQDHLEAAAMTDSVERRFCRASPGAGAHA